MTVSFSWLLCYIRRKSVIWNNLSFVVKKHNKFSYSHRSIRWPPLPGWVSDPGPLRPLLDATCTSASPCQVTWAQPWHHCSVYWGYWHGFATLWCLWNHQKNFCHIWQGRAWWRAKRQEDKWDEYRHLQP